MARPRKEQKYSVIEMTQYLRTNDQMLYSALTALYRCQLADEQERETSIHNNRRGFAKPDAKNLTALAKMLQAEGNLNFDNTQWLRTKLLKRYMVQITKIANAEWEQSRTSFVAM